MIDQGTHDYGRGPINKAAILRSGPKVIDSLLHSGASDDTEAQRAQARQATVPTLAELMADSDMVTTDAGAMVPAKLAARGDAGWEFDVDRDSEMAAKLADLVKALDSLAERYRAGQLFDAFTARQAIGIWEAIRRITQGGQS